MPESMPGEVRSAGDSPLVLSFTQFGRGDLALAGGKGANLGELTRAGFPVPPGFCVTTAAYHDFVRESGELDALLDALDGVTHEELGIAVYRPGHRLPGEAQVPPPRGAPGGRRAADGRPRGVRDHVHRRPDHR